MVTSLSSSTLSSERDVASCTQGTGQCLFAVLTKHQLWAGRLLSAVRYKTATGSKTWTVDVHVEDQLQDYRPGTAICAVVKIVIPLPNPRGVLLLRGGISKRRRRSRLVWASNKQWHQLYPKSNRNVLCLTYYRCNNYVFFKVWFCVFAWTWHHWHLHLKCLIT